METPEDERRENKMHPDVRVLLAAVHSRDDKLTAIQGAVADLPDQISKAVEAAIMRAAASEAMWSAASTAIQRMAKSEAGGWLFGGLAAMLRRVLWVLLFGVAIYMVGGWTALLGAIKSWTASP